MAHFFPSMDSLPQEIWLRIFHLVDDAQSLHSVVSACRKFYSLGTEALVRNIAWRTIIKARNHLEFWDRNPTKTHLVRSIYLSLDDNGTDAEQDHPEIFGRIQSFPKLQHLKLAFGAVPDVLYPTLQALPSVTHLTLTSCSIPPPPPFFPLSFPSPNPPAEIQVTHLTVLKLRPTLSTTFNADAVTAPIAYHLPNLQSFTTDSLGIQIPVDASARLTSLTINLMGLVGDVQSRLDAMLHRMPALVHLDVSIATYLNQLAPHGTALLSPQPPPALPALRTLCAPWPAAGHIAPGAPELTHFRVTSPIPKSADAVWLLEHLRSGVPLLRVALLRLSAWDDEVLLAAARCLPSCEVLEVVYHDAGPSDSFLFDLGIQHLPLMRSLHTLRIFSRPALAAPAAPRFHWDAEDQAIFDEIGPILLPDIFAPSEPPSAGEDGEEQTESEKEREKQMEREREKERTAVLGECVHAWTRYNPLLRRVQLGRVGEGRTWVRGEAGEAGEAGRGGGARGWKAVVEQVADMEREGDGDGNREAEGQVDRAAQDEDADADGNIAWAELTAAMEM
ncbi:F-box domain-containing protein [Favolaschia claudopus]|uniref:F-box domain-containing protein n=1 Tax=Favolaschia claudopus TaxID=2862362 RepID=A0AAW0BEY4_9AGAR